MRRQRGSICLYVAVLLLALAVVFAAVVPLSTTFRGRSTRRTDELRARLAFDAGVALVRSQEMTFTSDLGTAVPVTVTGATASVTPSDNAAQLAKSVVINGTGVRNGRSYRFSRVIGYRLPSPFYFALLSDTVLDLSGTTLTTGANGADGDVYSGDQIKLSPASRVNGSALAKKAITAAAGVVTGRTVPNYADLAWVTVADADYFNEATSLTILGAGVVVLTSATLNNGIAFATPELTSAYPIWYYGGNLSLKGTMSGRGTVYVKGNLTISGDLRYATPSDEVAIVVNGRITVASGVSTMDGTFYANGTFTSSVPSLTVSRGLVVAKSAALSGSVSIVRDNVARDDGDEATRLRLPYYWP